MLPSALPPDAITSSANRVSAQRQKVLDFLKRKGSLRAKSAIGKKLLDEFTYEGLARCDGDVYVYIGSSDEITQATASGDRATRTSKLKWFVVACLLVTASSLWFVRNAPKEKTRKAISIPLSAKEVFTRCSPAVVHVMNRDGNGALNGSGSGFVVSDGLVATNLHVILNASSVQVVFSDDGKLDVTGIAAYDANVDIAILRVANRIKVKPLQLSDGGLPEVGNKVFAIGNQLGLTNTLSDGLVSGYQETAARTSEIMTTAPISPGSSGGPLIDTDGKVIGVTTASLIGGQNLNIAVPAWHVARLVEEAAEGKPIAQPPVRPNMFATRFGGNPTASSAKSRNTEYSLDYVRRIKAQLHEGPITAVELLEIVGRHPDLVQRVGQWTYIPEFNVNTKVCFGRVLRYFPYTQEDGRPGHYLNLLLLDEWIGKGLSLTHWYCL